MMNTCSILVNSCDKFSSAWHPFFTLLRKYWPNCPYKVYLNTESLDYSDYNVETLNSNNSSWTGRLMNSLKIIDTDYVIFLLEDFFLMGYVKDNVIESIIMEMNKDQQIAVVYPKKITGFDNRDIDHPEWIRMDYNKNNRYLVNCQFAIWNRRALLSILKPGMSPWEMERSLKIGDNCDYKFYCSPQGSKFSIEGDVFPYYFAIQNGYGIAKSKWLWNNKKFFKEEGIIVDYSTLGSLSYLQYIMNKIKSKIRLK